MLLISNFLLLPENILLYGLNPLFIMTCFTSQNMVSIRNALNAHENNVCSAVIGWSALSRSIKSRWLIVFFKSSKHLLIFCLRFNNYWRCWKSNCICELVISHCSSISLFLTYLEVVMHILRILISSCWTDLFIIIDNHLNP